MMMSGAVNVPLVRKTVLKPFLSALLGVILVAPDMAHAWRAMNRHEVLPVSEVSFEVISRVGAAPRAYWCGAGDYARRVLGVATKTPIYLTRAFGASETRPGRKAVRFSLTKPPGGPVPDALTLSTKRVGDHLSVGFAVNFCYGDDPFDPWDRMRLFD